MRPRSAAVLFMAVLMSIAFVACNFVKPRKQASSAPQPMKEKMAPAIPPAKTFKQPVVAELDGKMEQIGEVSAEKETFSVQNFGKVDLLQVEFSTVLKQGENLIRASIASRVKPNSSIRFKNSLKDKKVRIIVRYLIKGKNSLQWELFPKGYIVDLETGRLKKEFQTVVKKRFTIK